MEQIYMEEHVSLNEEQRKFLDGDDDKELKVEVYDKRHTSKTNVMHAPSADEVPLTDESDTEKKDDGMITVVEHGADLLPIPGSVKKMKRPPMNAKEEQKAVMARIMKSSGEVTEEEEPYEDDWLSDEGLDPVLEEEDDSILPIEKVAEDTPRPRADKVPFPPAAPPAAPPAVRKRKTELSVVFNGTFGRIKAKYLDIYTEGMYFILVEDEDAEFSYTPPISDDIFTAKFKDKEYQLVSPGISFDMKNQKIRTTILLIVKGD